MRVAVAGRGRSGVPPTLPRLIAVLHVLVLPAVVFADQASDAELYTRACAACHGDDGRGRSEQEVGFDTPLPDFTDCSFASREPDPDWYAVIHEGGPVRAFDRMMPAFGDALGAVEIQAILGHVRKFCVNDAWPRGEFNLPRPLFTEKAYPEDEIVVTALVDAEGGGGTEAEFLYEKRFGPRGMIEIAVPIEHRGGAGVESGFDLGDLALGYKHTVYHDLRRGSIFSLGAEALLVREEASDGSDDRVTVFEPYAAYGHLLPGDAFLQFQALGEIGLEDAASDAAALRATIGRTWSEGEFGRVWTPMLEVLAERKFASGASVEIDLVPQVQVSLNTRQHVLLNAGVRLPLEGDEGRDVQAIVYLLWDWFDGGLLDGW